MTLYFGDILPYVAALLDGLWTSIFVTVASMLFGSLLGVALYLGKAGGSRVLKVLSVGYIGAFRNTPLLVQLYLIYFGFPELGINFNPLWSALIALTLNNAAYTAEIYRGGIQSVPSGLREAGSALGMSPRQIFAFVVIPPAIRNVFPALTNQFILLFLASSIASIIALPELTHVILGVNAETYRTIEVFTIGGLLYYLSSTLLAMASRFASARLFRWSVRTNG